MAPDRDRRIENEVAGLAITKKLSLPSRVSSNETITIINSDEKNVRAFNLVDRLNPASPDWDNTFTYRKPRGHSVRTLTVSSLI